MGIMRQKFSDALKNMEGNFQAFASQRVASMVLDELWRRNKAGDPRVFEGRGLRSIIRRELLKFSAIRSKRG